MESLEVNKDFWKNKKVLVTGHTGFKGSWLSLWLQHMGADVTGVSLDPPTSPSLYKQAKVEDGMTSFHADICDMETLKRVFHERCPEIVIHMAAQSLVRYSYSEPVETYQTNVMGTLNVLEAIREVGTVKSAVMVTTDKCYENKEWVWGYRETDPMGGYDPYSSSKGCAELLISSYRNSYFSDADPRSNGTAIASVRAGNVIGGGDWADDRLIPDILRAFSKGSSVSIRSPNAIRPWQHVLEPLAGYMLLAEKLYMNGSEFAESWNFGPQEEDVKPVSWIVEKIGELWGEGADWEIDEGDQPHEANYLKLDCSKVHAQLSWWSRWDLKYALMKIVDWHKAEIDGLDLRKVCISQIDEYMGA